MSKENFQHPSRFVNLEIIEIIRHYSAEAEKLKRLHPSQLDLIRKSKWFKGFIPPEYGGLGWTLPDALGMEEALSYADGSAGWVITLCSGAGWFVGFVNAEIAREFFMGDDVCVAGTGAITGVAEETDHGYVVNGVWKYASGALHATAFTANCYVTKNGEAVVNADGSDRFLTFIFKHEEVTIYDTWRSMGMIATGSHSFEVRNLEVPSDRCFELSPSRLVLNDPVYKFPFLQLAETTLSANMSGMALRFLELAKSIMLDRSMDHRRIVVARKMLDKSRTVFRDTVEASWMSLVSKGEVPKTLLDSVSDVSHGLVRACRQAVETIYPHCGLAAANLDSEINRTWRNFHTAGQHALFRAS